MKQEFFYNILSLLIFDKCSVFTVYDFCGRSTTTLIFSPDCPTKIVNFDMKESRKDWKYGNKTFIRCTDEKLMTTRTHTQFFRDTTARCKEDATWYYSDVECYQGNVGNKEHRRLNSTAKVIHQCLVSICMFWKLCT